MYPVLYPANATVFTNQGLGALSDAISCKVTEERNGEFEVEMVYPISGLHFNELAEGMLIKAKPNDFSKPQLFSIYDIEKEFGGRVSVRGEHIAYRLNDYPVLPNNEPSSASENGVPPVDIWTHYAVGDSNYTPPISVGSRELDPTAFTFETDFTDPVAISFEEVINLRSLLGGREGSLLDVCPGEFEFDNFDIILHRNRGQDNGVTIKYGKDLTDLTQEISIDGLFTHIFPYAKKTTNPEGASEPVEEWIYAPTGTSSESYGRWDNRVLSLQVGGESLESMYGFRRVKLLDLTDAFDPDLDFSSNDVKLACESYISDNSELIKPKITLTVSFEPKKVKSGDRYAENLEKIGLCDTVRVQHPHFGIDEKLKVNKTVYDVLNERYKSIDIGDAKSNFADTLRSQFDL